MPGRMPGETEAAYTAFTRFVGLAGDERSFDGVAAVLGGRKGQLARVQRWAELFDWLERANAFDKARIEAEDIARHSLFEERVDAFREALWAPFQILIEFQKTLAANPEAMTIEIAEKMMTMLDQALAYQLEALCLDGKAESARKALEIENKLNAAKARALANAYAGGPPSDPSLN